MPEKRKIFLPFAPSDLSAAAELIADGAVYYTCAVPEMAAELEKRLREQFDREYRALSVVYPEE